MSVTYHLLLAAVIAVTVTAVSYPLIVRPVLHRYRIVDVSSERSLHRGTALRGGGAAVAVGVIAGWLAGTNGTDHASAAWVVLVGALVLTVLGAWDDVRSLPAVTRLIVQVVTGAAAGIALTDEPSLLAMLLGVIAVPLVVNAVNFMDGIDGMTSLTAAATSLVWVVVGISQGATTFTFLAILPGAAALGFLPWNLATRLFLGDVGSYLIGGWFALTAAQGIVAGVPWPVVVAPLLPYFIDVGATLVHRARRGALLMSAHREHAYQTLVARGASHLQAALIWAMLALGSGLIVHAAPPKMTVSSLIACAIALLVGWLVLVRPTARAS
jgi:UDP-GlcNAc:undecaprenyl-phosphate/decaprenyl-phosphate GlcNAc-1-phosphate transferase